MFGKPCTVALRRALLLWITAASITLHAKTEIAKQADIVIIGAGLSGLILGYELKTENFVILEGSEHIGGRVSTEIYEIDGQLIKANSGMEEFWQSNPIVKILEELKIPVKASKAASSLMIDGQLYPFNPNESKLDFLKRIMSAQEFSALLQVEKQMTDILSQLKTKNLNGQFYDLKNMSFAEFISKQNLPHKTSEWIRVTIEPEIGTEWHKISALDGMAEFEIFLGEGQKTYQISAGNEQLTNRLASEIGKKRIFLHKTVKSIETKNGQVEIHYEDVLSKESGVIIANKVVSTIPVPKLKDVTFSPDLSPSKYEAIKSLRAGHYFKIHMVMNQEVQKYFVNGDGSSMLPILTDSPIGVIYQSDLNRSENFKLLTLLVFGKDALKISKLDLMEQKAWAVRELEKIVPGAKEHIQEINLYPGPPKSIAVWPPGRSRFDRLSQELRRSSNGIYFAGDFTESSHSDGAAKSAYRVAKSLNCRSSFLQ